LNNLERLEHLLSIPGTSGRESAVSVFIEQQLLAAGLPKSAISHDTAHHRSSHGGEIGNLVVKLPVPQQEIADYLGLTSVHVSRTLHKMHDDGLIAIEDSLITICQPDTLAELAEFDRQQVHVSTIPEPLRRALLDCN